MLEGVSATTIAAGCILARIASTIGFLPIFGERRIPPQIAAILVLALVFSIITANPALLEMEPLSITTATLAIGSEAFLGMLSGLAARIVLSAVPMAGQMMGGVGGLRFSGMLDPMGSKGGNSLGAMLSSLLALMIVGSGALSVWLGMLLRSFQTIPPGAAAIRPDGLNIILEGMHTSFAVAFVLAAPILGSQLAGHAVLALAQRASPKTNLFFAVGFLIPIVLGGFALFLNLSNSAVLFTQMIERATANLSAILFLSEI